MDLNSIVAAEIDRAFQEGRNSFKHDISVLISHIYATGGDNNEVAIAIIDFIAAENAKQRGN